jgi:hypothetical protein
MLYVNASVCVWQTHSCAWTRLARRSAALLMSGLRNGVWTSTVRANGTAMQTVRHNRPKAAVRKARPERAVSRMGERIRRLFGCRPIRCCGRRHASLASPLEDGNGGVSLRRLQLVADLHISKLLGEPVAAFSANRRCEGGCATQASVASTRAWLRARTAHTLYRRVVSCFALTNVSSAPSLLSTRRRP